MIKMNNSIKIISTFVLIISLTGCGQNPVPAPAPTQSQNTTTPPAATAQTNQTTVYMIKPDDNGASANSVKVGCGDSAVPVTTTTISQYDAANPVASINAAILVIINMTANQFQAQNLQNPLASQQVTIQSVDQSGTQLVVHLDGQFSFGGTCEMPRVRAQIEETIKKAALPGNTYTIDWNGGGQTAWDKAFSLKD
ncbi:MAG: hypothetical protein NTX63_05570 [Candidatus Peregrinibacteria bacterium]|nr:hypothetical protein [Candidatus Peregrinibacteria bacterium]